LKTYHIGVIAGDGIGPEVTREAVSVLRATGAREGFALDFTEFPFGAEHYLKTKETFPSSALDECAKLDSVLLGALGDPRLEPGLIERPIIFGLRQGLDLYVNYRPVKLLAEHLCPLKNKRPADVDMIVLRENTEDVYAGAQGNFKKNTPDEVATAEMIFTRKGTERIIRYAFETARMRAAGRLLPDVQHGAPVRRAQVTLVDKANAIRSMDLWTRTFADVASEYPEIAANHLYVDAACMFLIKSPEQFDVIVTSNLFGDILTDLGAVIQGGMGSAASGNIHPGRSSVFEPVHGSAPDIAGKGIASPVGAILSAALLLDHLGESGGARRIEMAVRTLLVSRRIPSVDAGSGMGTREAGALVCGELQSML
jgi:3-isopropylmalate dehydrogenase